MEFGKKDRDLIIKLAKQIQDVDKRLKAYEKKNPAPKAELPAAILSDGFNFEETNDDVFFEDSDLRAISIAFNDPTTAQNKRVREILAQTIFKAIQDLCIAHGIASLAVTIENV